MSKTLVAGGIAVLAVFAGVLYFARDPAQTPPATEPPAVVESAVKAPFPGSERPPPRKPVVSDPRLAALMASPDDALLELVAAPDGKVIAEIDNDPDSAGYRKPLREYTYAGDQVVVLVSYRYVDRQVRTTRVMVTYKADGSVDQYQESTQAVPEVPR